MNELIQWIIALAFAVVSLSLTAKFLMEAYLEYIQVKHGIRVITQKEFEDYMRAMAEEEEDETQ
mgnify:FL=1|jgi:hypothetical protein